jgi:hypothetical protein
MLAKRGYVRSYSGLCGLCSWMLALLVFGFLVSLGHAQDTTGTLSVTIGGSGTVSGEGDSVLCPGKCSVDFEVGDQIVLITTPDVGFRFEEWGGACSGTTAICTVAMTQDQSVTATFSIAPPDSRRLLSVRLVGNASYLNGPIIVISTPDGIYCPPDCSHEYDQDTQVTLTAAHLDPEVEFRGWEGGDEACNGGDPPPSVCTVIMEADRVVLANFTIESVPTNLDVEVSGRGRVTSGNVSLDCLGPCSCPGDCSWLFGNGATVTIESIPESAWQFADWDGDCIGQGNPCTIAMDQERSVSAIFKALPPSLDLRVNQPIFKPQDTHILTIEVTPGGNLQQAVDFYLGIQFPTQSFFLWHQQDGSFTKELRPYLSNWTVNPFLREFVRHTFTGQETSGQYLWLAGFTEVNTPLTIIGETKEAPFTFTK